MHGCRTTPGTEDDHTDVGGTPPWMEKVENVGNLFSRERPDDYRDIGGSESLEHFLEHVLEDRKPEATMYRL